MESVDYCDKYLDPPDTRECGECERLTDRLDELEKENLLLRTSVNLLLDAVDYTNGSCRLNEMVGAILDEQIIKIARSCVEKIKYE